MDLLGIVYVSKALEHFDDELLNKTDSLAAKQNQKFQITGYLYFEKEFFIQYIEGSRLNVLRLYSNIQKDTRHELLNVQISNTLLKRKFPLWSMRKLQKNELRQINMEHVIMDYMIHAAQVQNKTLKEETIWRIIDKLSKLQHNFKT